MGHLCHVCWEIYQENHILQVKHIHQFYALAFVFRCLKDTPIEPFKDYFTRRGEEHEYYLRNNDNLSTNQIFLNTGKITTPTNGAILWNNCPANITDVKDIGSFKRSLFEYYSDMYQEETISIYSRIPLSCAPLTRENQLVALAPWTPNFSVAPLATARMTDR